MSLKILIFYFFSSIFFLTNNLFASHVTVVDGDTIKLGDIKIRFSGIDAPEINQICVASEGKVACGKISRDILITKVTNNKISCTDEGKDFYGRVLGECFVNGESLTFSFYIKSTSARTGVALTITTRDSAGGGGTVTRATGVTFNSTTGWTRVEKTFTLSGTVSSNNRCFHPVVRLVWI